ncbi:MAG: 3-hydroxyacyl-CoA dehydrogenase, partial [Rhodobacteraceae bacterium]|nr:3-hydroxyacyl-CoA dehydrogenase [Paracoccaceae bacterium]
MAEPDVNKRVAIIGAGLIGCSWAALFLKHGWDVRIW